MLRDIRSHVFRTTRRRLEDFPSPTAAALDNVRDQEGHDVQNAEQKDFVRWLEPVVTGDDGGPAYDPFDYERIAEKDEKRHQRREARRLAALGGSVD